MVFQLVTFVSECQWNVGGDTGIKIIAHTCPTASLAESLAEVLSLSTGLSTMTCALLRRLHPRCAQYGYAPPVAAAACFL
jgi:hypothetical protein